MTGLIQDGIGRSCDRSSAFNWGEHRRKLRFLLVGALCFTFQYAVLRALSGAGMARPAANGVGFVISAQANFLLSSVFTWADRTQVSQLSTDHLRANRGRWVSYNLRSRSRARRQHDRVRSGRSGRGRAACGAGRRGRRHRRHLPRLRRLVFAGSTGESL